MVEIKPTQWRAIQSHAISQHPREMCGILTVGEFIPAENIHSDREHAFAIDPIWLQQYAGKILAIVHSHCRDVRKPEIFDTRTPSYADVKSCKASGVPWLIVATDGRTVTPALQIPRIPSRDYIGRPFIWFVNDCYTIVQDYYRFELGIELPDHKVEIDYKALRNHNKLFDEYIADYGFVESKTLDGMKSGDLILIDNAGFSRNHLGIVHDRQIIHQDMLSHSEPIERFLGRINCVLKYAN